ncbi:MAG: type II secretion system F family protein [Candidatus Thorarchaeota archaeon]
MLLNIAIMVFSAVFLSTLAVFLILRRKLGQENRQISRRLNSLIARDDIPDEFLMSLMKDTKLSKIPLLDRLLNKFRFARKLQLLIIQAGSTVNPGTLVLSMLSLGGLLCLLTLQVTSIFSLALPLGVAGALLPVVYLVLKRKKRVERFELLLPEALDMITNALMSGFSLDSAMRMVSQEIPNPLGTEMAITFEERNLGIELSDALYGLKQRVPSDDLEILINALLIHKKTGGNLAEILKKTSATIRDRVRLKREVKTKTIHGRFSGMVLILLPVIMAALIYLIFPDYVMILVEERVGNYLLIAAITMQIIGVFVIRKIVNIRI